MQERDTKGLWDRCRVKDLRETLPQASLPPTWLWVPLFTRQSKPANLVAWEWLLARAICWPRAAGIQGTADAPSSSRNLTQHPQTPEKDVTTVIHELELPPGQTRQL